MALCVTVILLAGDERISTARTRSYGYRCLDLVSLLGPSASRYVSVALQLRDPRQRCANTRVLTVAFPVYSRQCLNTLQ